LLIIRFSEWKIKLALTALLVGPTGFFYNLFPCAEGHGNPTNGMFGITPPSVDEYLFLVNDNLLIPLPRPLNNEDNFDVEDAANHLYFHIV